MDHFERLSSLRPLPWDRGRAEKEARAMFASTALKPVAAAMAGAHPHALDYIRQAPIIVLAAAAGRPHRMNGKRLRTALHESLGARCRRGERLRDVMAGYGCPQALRALSSRALALNQWRVICMLRAMTPARLAPIIPRDPRAQQDWLRSLVSWVDHVTQRGHRTAMDKWFEWAAGALSRSAGSTEAVVTAVADLFIAASATHPVGNARVDASWTFKQAEAAALRWHAAMQREAEERRRWAVGGRDWRHNQGFERQVDYSPLWNDAFILGDFEVVPLRSGRELSDEGAAMHHCVGSYAGDVITGRSRIFSIREKGRRVATIELGMPTWIASRLRLLQARGPCNGPLRPQVRDIALQIASDAQDLLRASAKAAPAANPARITHVGAEVFALKSADAGEQVPVIFRGVQGQ